MKTITLYDYEIDFLKDLLREYQKRADRDTRMMAADIDQHITEQVPDKVYEISLLTGELIEIEIH